MSLQSAGNCAEMNMEYRTVHIHTYIHMYITVRGKYVVSCYMLWRWSYLWIQSEVLYKVYCSPSSVEMSKTNKAFSTFVRAIIL